MNMCSELMRCCIVTHIQTVAGTSCTDPANTETFSSAEINKIA